MKSLKWFALPLMGFAVAVVIAGCGSSGGMQQPLIVTMGMTPTAVQPGASAQISATVGNDGSNRGVNWAVTCSPGGATCGSVLPANTASGAPTTYTAPTIPPAGDLMVTITATAAADGTTAVSANFRVPGITVNVPAPSATMLQANGTAQVTANVTGDAANKGVTWTVSCTPAPCGIVAPSPALSGVATTYTAPSAPPAGNLVVTITAASVTNAAAMGSTTVTIVGITVSIAPTSASVQSAGTQQFTATVGNDPSNGGVTWSLQYSTASCTIFHHCITTFHPCSSQCGSVSATTTASGVATTYTAPNTPPHFTGFLPGGPYLVATSVVNTRALSRTQITVLAISVSVSSTPASVAVNATQAITATVTNDGANGGAGAGVTWTLKQNGIACSPGCGTISPTGTASGAAATYTAPATVPAVPFLTITANSVTDMTKSASVTITVTTTSGAACGAGAGSESLLKGQYAFRLQGVGSNGGGSAYPGSFTADGTGKITGGEVSAGIQVDATRSAYWVGPDHRGCLVLAITNSGITYYRFSLGGINSSNIATAGHIIEFDDTTGGGTRVAGTLKLQDATSFAGSKFKGTYVIGLSGQDGAGGRFALVGTLTTDGVSAITASNLDIDDAGTVTSNIASAPGGSFTCCDANGEGTLQLTAGSFSGSLVLYMVSSSEVFFGNSGAGYGGEAIGLPTGTTFNQASLTGAAVIRKTAQLSTGPIVDIALASSNGTGGTNITDNTNNAGTFSSATTAFTYTVASNGRVTLIGGTKPPVLYLYGQNAGFLVGTDTNVELGIIESQATGPFDATSLSGAYTLGTENPSAMTVALESGVATPDGKGNAPGTVDQSSSAGLAQNQNLGVSYSVSSNGTGTFGAGTTAILISGSKLVFINNTSATPTITVVEK